MNTNATDSNGLWRDLQWVSNTIPLATVSASGLVVIWEVAASFLDRPLVTSASAAEQLSWASVRIVAVGTEGRWFNRDPARSHYVNEFTDPKVIELFAACRCI